MICDTWQWHVTHDRWGEVNLLLKFQIPSSYGLVVTVFWRYFHKGWVSDFISDEGICRIAPTKPVNTQPITILPILLEATCRSYQGDSMSKQGEKCQRQKVTFLWRNMKEYRVLIWFLPFLASILFMGRFWDTFFFSKFSKKDHFIKVHIEKSYLLLNFVSLYLTSKN